jgi:hypothetical protein
MLIKTLVASLGLFSIFLAGLFCPGISQASTVYTYKLDSIFIEEGSSFWKYETESGPYINEAAPNLLLANQRYSSMRKNYTRNYKKKNYQLNRSPKSYRPSRKTSPTYSQRKRSPTNRSSLGKGNNNFQNNRNLAKWPKSRRYSRHY